jgi:prolyl-tRNA synthetase
MFRLRDRRGTDYCLAMTHEEAFTELARGELRSYRELPQIWYQIGTKFRDEPRPRAGLLRVREFLMKDAYSFDRDAAGLDINFLQMKAAYERIYARCELETFGADAFSGAMGGRQSIEFVTRCEAGEDEVVHCSTCGYAANMEVAESSIPVVEDHPPETDLTAPTMFPTPGVLTIEALAAPPHSVPAIQQLKTLVYIADGRPVIAVVRGDHALNEAKLQIEAGASGVRAADAEEVFALMGALPGSLGAVSVTRAPVFVDRALADRTNMVTGANQDGFHLRGVDVVRHIIEASAAQVADLRRAAQGETCANCHRTPLEVFPALEVGHIFKLGTRYSERLGATILDESGAEVALVMGSYGIGLGRLIAAVVEQHHDANGMVWPRSLAPYDVTVVTLGPGPELAETAERVIAQLVGHGVDVLYDDRDVRAGVKLKDADLIGIPIRIAISPRSLAQDAVEWKLRGAREASLVPIAEVGLAQG